MKYIYIILIHLLTISTAICQDDTSVSMWQRDGKINVVICVIAILFGFISLFVFRLHTRLKKLEDFKQDID